MGDKWRGTTKKAKIIFNIIFGDRSMELVASEMGAVYVVGVSKIEQTRAYTTHDDDGRNTKV